MINIKDIYTKFRSTPLWRQIVIEIIIAAGLVYSIWKFFKPIPALFKNFLDL